MNIDRFEGRQYDRFLGDDVDANKAWRVTFRQDYAAEGRSVTQGEIWLIHAPSEDAMLSWIHRELPGSWDGTKSNVSYAHRQLSPSDLFITNANEMRVTARNPNQDRNFSFTGKNGEEFLRIDPNGEFFVKGKLVARDIEVYRGVIRWLDDMGY